MRYVYLYFVCLAAIASAQIRSDSGAILGTVEDDTGARIVSAHVSAVQEEQGLVLRTESASDGTFRFESLPPGTYRLRVEAGGFSIRETGDITVEVGGTVSLTLNLALAPAAFKTVVEASAPVLDFERTQQSHTLNSELIENLPINQRNYLDFATLTPGVVATATVANSADYRIPVLQTSGLSVGGSNGRGNSFTIDGVENVGSVGNVRPGISQEAVREFIVNRNSYSAELGGGYGAAVNVVSKSGDNNVHGSVFGLFRDRSLDARNYFDPAKSAFTRVQDGFSIGGPVKKERIFYFAAFERLDRHESTFVPILEDRNLLNQLTPSQQALTTYLASSAATSQLAAGLAFALKPSSNPAVRPLFDENSGVFPFSSATTQISLRMDARVSDRNSFFLRANVSGIRDENAQFGALVGYSRGVTDVFRDGTLALGDHLMLGDRWLSVSRLSIGYNRYSGIPNDPVSPEINIDGAGSFGRDSQYPYQRREIHLQLQQTFSYTTSRHTVKFGVDLNPIRTGFETIPWHGGRFEFASVLPLALVLNNFTRDPNFANNLGAQLAGAGRYDLANALGDPITSLQAFSLGLPVAYFQGFGSPHYDTWQQRTGLFVEENWRAGRGLFINMGLRFQGQANEGVRYLRDFAPRAGLTWSPKGTVNWVVRAGGGMFPVLNDVLIPYATYGFKPQNAHIVLVPLTGLPYVINPQTGQPVNSADIYQGLLAKGILGHREIQLSDLAPYGFTPGYATPTTGDLSPVFRSAYTTQASLEVEHSTGPYTFSAGYTYSRGVHLPRLRDYNLKIVGTRPDGWPIFGAVDPTLISNYVIESTGNSWYNAMVLQASRRFQNRWTVNASYTLSRALDDVTDYGFDFAAQNQFDNSAEKGLSLFHQKHRVLTSVVYQAPHRAASDALSRMASDWTLSGILQANSFRPFNVTTGFDNLGDNLTTTHRPLGLGRDVGIGPGFASVDFRLARAIALPREGLRLNFTAEVFNIANHTNFVSVNNVVGDLALNQLPQPLKGQRGIPTQPFSFTSAADPRQVQLGLRLQF